MVAAVPKRPLQSVAVPVGYEVGALVSTSAEMLAEVFLDAYRDTIDDEGESLQDAFDEVKNVLAGAYGALADEYSAVIVDGSGVLSALFVAKAPNGKLFIPYVVTAKRCGRRGLARALIQRCLERAQRDGVDQVELYVTEGNDGAVALYRSLGFEVVLP